MNNLKLSPQAVPRNVIRACPHLHDLEEHLIYEEGSPTILLGQDNWHLLLTHAVRQGDRHQPIATLTDLGWVLHGTKRSNERVNTHKVLHAVAPDDEESMEQMMREHFSLESLAVIPRRSHNDDERRALQQLEDKTRRLPAGGFETGLLWRNEHVRPPDSYDVALRRLELVEKKLDRDEELKKRWIPTKMNVADDATRDVPHDFDSNHRWYRGPDFLYMSEENWPQEEVTDVNVTDEERVHLTTGVGARLKEALPARCGPRAKRTRKNADADPTWRKNDTESKKTNTSEAARGKQVLHKFKTIDASYLRHAESLWIRAQQEEAFTEEINALMRGTPFPPSSRLMKLSTLLDGEGIIRLRSRIAAAGDITEQQRSPAVLDGDHPWVRLYIAWIHKQTHHGGFGITTSEVRQHYWLLRLRNAVRSELKRCRVCRIMRATPPQPSTGNHPPSRLPHHQRPFTYTGLDFFGPLQGTNLRGADAELQRAALEAIQEDASIRFIKWRYIPPSAPFMGGAWERLVRSIKTALYTVLHERAPKEEVLHTLLVEAEHTLNSRPLTHVSTAPEDENPLTPNHFLLGGPSRVPLPGAFTDTDIDGRKIWRTSQRLADMFWSRWIKEYLPDLQHRRTPRATNGALQLGDLVFIADGTLPRNTWPRGIIVATYPGPDGEIRAVDVRTNRGILRRPTKKLVIIATGGNETTKHEP
ncbi:uncharacterized protein LOC113231928 [Hyposmocoma kahamanoa]|uniref:uncharacterized protein LOC113231928 n=1 Tax=Hyposmocoma kahamanoa TaxID=1477025 RepID=UPI000E6D98EA|nr:uncharacterized protein LOC113231928 [Hyposmocoma kahamanoa]